MTDLNIEVVRCLNGDVKIASEGFSLSMSKAQARKLSEFLREAAVEELTTKDVVCGVLGVLATIALCVAGALFAAWATS